MANLYDFRPGHSLKNVNPQEVGGELERLRAEKGALTPAVVVEEAEQNPDSPLRGAFEWENTKAAHQYRLMQARRLIVSVRVINSPVQTNVPAFVSVRSPQGRSYVPTVEAMDDEQLKFRVLTEVRQFIEGMERRYSHFQEVADLLAGMKKSVG